MIVIADSGSSKTDWRLISNEGVVEATQTIGLNPHIISASDFKKVLQNSDLVNWPLESVNKVYFYGAGITGIKLQGNLANWLKTTFSVSEILASSDLLAAARAIYGTEDGIIGILGTGSNSGYYNGSEIEQTVPALGYMLGDEGSGNALGKRLLTSFLRDELPDPLADEFRLFYPEHEDLISNIYESPQLAKLLASFVPFIHQHQDSKFMEQLAIQEFTEYFKLLRKYKNISKVGLVGSVAFYFSNTLHKVAGTEGIKIYRIIKSPIDSLSLYHRAELS
jgi:glucosamine kinase